MAQGDHSRGTQRYRDGENRARGRIARPGFYAETAASTVRAHEAIVSKPGIKDRNGVFFAAIEMTQMPMILTDPNLPDNPVVFANRAFGELTGYEQDEVDRAELPLPPGAADRPVKRG